MQIIEHRADARVGGHPPSRLRGIVVVGLLIALMLLTAWLVRDVRTPSSAPPPCSVSCYR